MRASGKLWRINGMESAFREGGVGYEHDSVATRSGFRHDVMYEIAR